MQLPVQSPPIQLPVTLPADTSQNALLYLVIATMLGTFVWVVRVYVTQIAPSVKEHTNVIRALPDAIGVGISKSVAAAFIEMRSMLKDDVKKVVETSTVCNFNDNVDPDGSRRKAG